MAEPAGLQHGTCRLALGACCTAVMGGLYTLLLARETVEREGALPWHCSLLWVMKAGKELNCFLHFPHRKTSSSSASKRNSSLLPAALSMPQSCTRQPQQGKARQQTPAVSWHLADIIVRRHQVQPSFFPMPSSPHSQLMRTSRPWLRSHTQTLLSPSDKLNPITCPLIPKT